MIYIHIPFCRSFCTYCDFYSEIASSCPSATFTEALVKEIHSRKQEIRENLSFLKGVNTLYIGGGTPSVLPLSAYKSILSALEEVGVSRDFKEFTVEVNPEDIVSKGQEYVEGLLKLGVNRVSMGVQSFDDGILKWMNRRHDSARAVKAYSILESAGVENISIDLIFGLPQLPLNQWEESIKRALDISSKGLPPKHISSYQLSVEPGSALAKMVQQGRWQEASEEVCAAQYEALCRILAESGYMHYEISNFAQQGYEAVHNSAYWEHLPYVGLGPGAHSFIAPDVRKWNKEDINAYVAYFLNKEGELPCDGESLDAEQLAMERLMLGLRTAKGVSESFARDFCGEVKVKKALSEGLIHRSGEGVLRIPESRFFVSDSIISSLI